MLTLTLFGYHYTQYYAHQGLTKGVVTLIYYAVVMSLTGLLTWSAKEEVELLCILQYIIGLRAKCVCGQMINE